MIDKAFVIKIHEMLINEYGGTHCIRDLNGIESALARPFASFDGNELYPNIFTKAAALIESLISNHPFLDGNKRIGYFCLRYFLLNQSFDIQASQQDKYNFVISIAAGKSSFEEIVKWIEKNSRKQN